MKQKGSGVVYSSEHGQMCPECDQPIARCQCQVQERTPPPGDGVARLRLETKGRNGKAVTTVSGLPLLAAELAILTKELKRRCGTGGTLKGFVIEIQGDHREVIETELRSRNFRVKRAGG